MARMSRRAFLSRSATAALAASGGVLFTNLLKAVQLGTLAQLLGLVTFQLSYR